MVVPAGRPSLAICARELEGLTSSRLRRGRELESMIERTVRGVCDAISGGRIAGLLMDNNGV